MGPYVQIELPISVYTAWDQLFSPHGLKYWLLTMSGAIQPGATLPIMMGDASRPLQHVTRSVVNPDVITMSVTPTGDGETLDIRHGRGHTIAVVTVVTPSVAEA